MDDLRALKRAVFGVLAERLAGLTIAGAPVRVRRSADAMRVEVGLPDGSQGLIHLATIKQGLPAGQFAIDPRALVHGGFLRSVLQQLPLPGRHLGELGAILCAAPSGAPTFAVRSAADRSVDEVVSVVRDEFSPLLAAFTQDWAAALRHTLANPDEVDRPYSTATVLSLMTDTSTAALEALAATDLRFWDRDLAQAAPGWRALVAALVAKG